MIQEEVAASSSGHLSDLSDSESTLRFSRKRSSSASLTRCLRFEDETDTEVESRYLERQKRQTGQKRTTVLVSKPNLKLYISGRTAQLEAQKPFIDTRQSGQMLAYGTNHYDAGRTVLVGGVNLNLHLQPAVFEDQVRRLYRAPLSLWTEPIRETYIGSVRPNETSRGRVAAKQVRRMTNPVQPEESHANLFRGISTTDLPINPYALDPHLTMAVPAVTSQPTYLDPSIKNFHSSSRPLPIAKMSQIIKLDDTKMKNNQNQNQEMFGRSVATRPHKELQFGVQPKEKSPCDEEGDMDLRVRKTLSSSTSSETTGDNICICTKM